MPAGWHALAAEKVHVGRLVTSIKVPTLLLPLVLVGFRKNRFSFLCRDEDLESAFPRSTHDATVSSLVVVIVRSAG